ncbi:hypothetical protein BJ912DRAFT_968361 [Pholiota molesta]|nr:hypothetical protein BJ912DRAFT_968361 [Pholiota molesta]
MGMYAIIYFGTMYIYFTRSASKRYVVPVTITALFLCNIIQTGFQWYAIKLAFVDNGATRDSVFVSLFDLPKWVYVAVDIPAYVGYVLADGLLIWRCFFVWNRSFRVISIPLFLFITENTLFLTLIIFRAIYGGITPDVATAIRINDLIFAAFLTTFIASLVTTVLIAYRIYAAAKQGRSKRRFRHVINIVVQSGALYCLALLVSAVAPVLPGEMGLRNTWNVALNYYTTALVSVIAGMSATVLVARVLMLPTDATFPSSSIHLSALRFHARSTHPPDTLEGVEANHSAGVDGNSPIEGLRVNDKVR